MAYTRLPDIKNTNAFIEKIMRQQIIANKISGFLNFDDYKNLTSASTDLHGPVLRNRGLFMHYSMEYQHIKKKKDNCSSGYLIGVCVVCIPAMLWEFLALPFRLCIPQCGSSIIDYNKDPYKPFYGNRVMFLPPNKARQLPSEQPQGVTIDHSPTHQLMK